MVDRKQGRYGRGHGKCSCNTMDFVLSLLLWNPVVLNSVHGRREVGSGSQCGGIIADISSDASKSRGPLSPNRPESMSNLTPGDHGKRLISRRRKYPRASLPVGFEDRDDACFANWVGCAYRRGGLSMCVGRGGWPGGDGLRRRGDTGTRHEFADVGLRVEWYISPGRELDSRGANSNSCSHRKAHA